MQRGNGILLAISSLPGEYGIGTMGREARTFIDSLRESAQRYWQILPVSPTGFGDSPYQSVSAFAGNPYFIDIETLYETGLLSGEEFEACKGLFGTDEAKVDYNLLYLHKSEILHQAFHRFSGRETEAYRIFRAENADWLTDYALYTAIKTSLHMKPIWQWPEPLRLRETAAIKAAEELLKDEIEYHVFVQYLFFSQWSALKSYANEQGIKIIGDMPIYIARDSADAWTNAWMLDPAGEKAGCPPDYFSCTGQLWGNPVYNWEALKQRGYDWWVRRAQHSLKLFDYIRLDHFRGFEAYYSIPAAAQTAETGRWVKGPGMGFFTALREKLGDLPFIAEDLGFLTPGVFELLKETGFPGLKVLQFAFEPESVYLPHQYERNAVVYTGTHDNNTAAGWYETLDAAGRELLNDYAGDVNADNVHIKLVRLAMSSVADGCILQMQDILGLPAEARMNTPQTALGNWKWRLRSGEFDGTLINKLKRLTTIYGRA